MTFTKWLETLITEKGLDREQRVEVEGPSGMNSIPLGSIEAAINSASASEQAKIKTTLVKIDFCNGDVMHFFKHLAQAIAI